MDSTTSNVMMTKLKRSLSKSDDGDSSDSDAEEKERLQTVMGVVSERDGELDNSNLVDTEFRRASDRLSVNMQAAAGIKCGGIVLDEVVASADHNMMNGRYSKTILIMIALVVRTISLLLLLKSNIYTLSTIFWI